MMKYHSRKFRDTPYRIQSPCFECGARCVDCHSNCKKYLDYHTKVEELRDLCNKKRLERQEVNDFKVELISKTYKKRNRTR